MSAATIANIPKGSHATRRVVSPLVVVDGVVAPRASVQSIRAIGPLDQREARLTIPASIGVTGSDLGRRRQRLAGAAIRVLCAHAFATGRSAERCLFAGRVSEVVERLDGGHRSWVLTARCDWSSRLDRSVTAPDSQKLSVGQAISHIASAIGHELKLTGIASETLDSRWQWPHRGAAPAGTVLGRLIADVGLIVTQSGGPGSGASAEVRLRSPGQGRRVTLGLHDIAGGATTLASIRSAVDAVRPRRWAASCQGQRVETTFPLVPGWDPASEGLGDDEYTRSVSSDFTQTTNTYRLWLANEDGAVSQAPYNQGEAYDLNGLFDEQVAIAPQPLPFLDPLTRDAEGRSQVPVLEVSLDAGVTWARYSGTHDVLRDRAGVYLNDDALPTAFFSAAKAGQARVRVTASLRSPIPIKVVRWQGNPFAGPFDVVAHDLDSLFAYRRVDQGSRFASAVRSGALLADEVDERKALTEWLVARTRSSLDRGRRELQTVGVMTDLRVGDRIDSLGGQSTGASLARSGMSPIGLTIAGVTHDWVVGHTLLDCRW